ncbi:hypothetical protein GCM10011369_20010 [Neiella marina]|uniref:Flagellar hook-length control protein-like C-terminal domain-containing protein n=1 Tax=Neiella marina TaxID=508461 RepID=A0A8J2U5D7_9GAMM|nr:flagellar hook-length control protein FliK [Neiella marina]GGA78106.1 hypothetical protein GCM10011369_20010 [Neiella marina]
MLYVAPSNASSDNSVWSSVDSELTGGEGLFASLFSQLGIDGEGPEEQLNALAKVLSSDAQNQTYSVEQLKTDIADLFHQQGKVLPPISAEHSESKQLLGLLSQFFQDSDGKNVDLTSGNELANQQASIGGIIFDELANPESQSAQQHLSLEQLLLQQQPEQSTNAENLNSGGSEELLDEGAASPIATNLLQLWRHQCGVDGGNGNAQLKDAESPDETDGEFSHDDKGDTGSTAFDMGWRQSLIRSQGEPAVDSANNGEANASKIDQQLLSGDSEEQQALEPESSKIAQKNSQSLQAGNNNTSASIAAGAPVTDHELGQKASQVGGLAEQQTLQSSAAKSLATQSVAAGGSEQFIQVSELTASELAAKSSLKVESSQIAPEAQKVAADVHAQTLATTNSAQPKRTFESQSVLAAESRVLFEAGHGKIAAPVDGTEQELTELELTENEIEATMAKRTTADGFEVKGLPTQQSAAVNIAMVDGNGQHKSAEQQLMAAALTSPRDDNQKTSSSAVVTQVAQQQVSQLQSNDRKQGQAKAAHQVELSSQVNSNSGDVSDEIKLETKTDEPQLSRLATSSTNTSIQGNLPHSFDGFTPTQFNQSLSSQLSANQSVSASQEPLSHAQQLAQVQEKMQLLQDKLAPVLGQRLMMMMDKQMQQAEIQLDPPELGSLMVRVQVQNDQAQVSFVAQSAQARDAIEQAIPRLREMMQQQQLELTQANVSHQRQHGGQGGQSGQEQQSGQRQQQDANGVDGQIVAENKETQHVILKAGMVDFYA